MNLYSFCWFERRQSMIWRNEKVVQVKRQGNKCWGHAEPEIIPTLSLDSAEDSGVFEDFEEDPELIGNTEILDNKLVRSLSENLPPRLTARVLPLQLVQTMW